MPDDAPEPEAEPGDLPADSDVEFDAPPTLDAELRARLLAEIAPFALAVDLRRWRAAVLGRAREERLLADLLRAGRVGSAPIARVSIGAELDLRLRELPPSPSGLDRSTVAGRLAQAREELTERPDDVEVARRWVRLRLLAGALRAHGPATPAVELIEVGDAGSPTAEEGAQVVAATAVDLAERQRPSPADVARAVRRLRAVASLDLAALLPSAEAVDRRVWRASVEPARLRLLAPELRMVDWGGPYPDNIDWLAWTEAAPVRPPEVREAVAPRMRRRLLVAAFVLPAVAAAAVLSLTEAPDAGRVDSSRLSPAAQAPPNAPSDRVVAAGLEVTDDWSSITVQLADTPRGDILELQLAGVAGEVVTASGGDGRWNVASVPVAANPSDVEPRTDGTTLVITLPRTLHPSGLRVLHFGTQAISHGAPIGSPAPAQPAVDALPVSAGASIAALSAPSPGIDWADLAFALTALAGAAAGLRFGLFGALTALAGLVGALAVGGVLAIPVARGLSRLTGDDRAAAAAAAALMAALAASALAAIATALARREPFGLRIARLRVTVAALPRALTEPLAALAGLVCAVIAAAVIAMLCVDLGPLGIAATRLRASITGTRAVDVARWVFGA